jgi:hypothetical protein
MTLLFALVEGVSEETFVRDVLSPHLAGHGVHMTAILVTTNRRLGRAGKGGLTRFARVREDLTRLMAEKPGLRFRFTTMFDLCRLPSDFPGLGDVSTLQPRDRALRLQTSLAQELGDNRLIPYLQVHEFEALVLADLEAMRRMFPGQEKAIATLSATVTEAGGPEGVNDTEPPSRRITQSLPAYSKVLAATQLASFSSLPVLRESCPHFDAWVRQLEMLGKEVSTS